MTIHRALSELKLIDAKIEKQTKEIFPVAYYQKDKKIFGRYSQDEFKKAAEGTYDSIIALIERKNKIKCAVVTANAATKVKVGGVEMTVAEAINYKTLINFKKALVETLRAANKKMTAEMNKGNEIVAANCQKVIEVTFGKDNVKVQPSDIAAVTTPFMEQNEYHIFDPLNVEKKIETLEKEYMDFEAEVDAVLSESNAVTFIEL